MDRRPLNDGSELKARIAQNPSELNRLAADLWVDLFRSRSASPFCVALAGGSTPRGLYSLMAKDEYRKRIDWEKVHFFWGDERCVPPDHPDSNHGMARESLLRHLSLPEGNVHPAPTWLEDPEKIAQSYQTELISFFKLVPPGLPRLDLVLLGLGEDGHTASLFPGASSLQVQERLVVPHASEELDHARVSFTLPLINQARNIVFLVSGSSKAEAVRRVFRMKSSSPLLPAERVVPRAGNLFLLLDAQAASAMQDETERNP